MVEISSVESVEPNSIASFATVIGIPIGIASASFSLTFSLCTGLVKNY